MEFSLDPEIGSGYREYVDISIKGNKLSILRHHISPKLEEFFGKDELEEFLDLDEMQTAIFLKLIDCDINESRASIETKFKSHFKYGSEIRDFLESNNIKYTRHSF